MQFEQEITVSVNISREELINFLNEKGYNKIESFVVDDTYYVAEGVDLKINSLDVLKKCVLLRSIDYNKHYLVYKYKEYDENENIINQGKSKVEVDNIKDADEFLKAIGYKELIKVLDYADVYELNGIQICVEYVNNKYLFIEVEERVGLNSINDMIKALELSGIDYDKSNYFVKKAKIIFEESYR